MDGLHGWIPERGTPQGAVISPLLANIYLNPLDHLLESSGFKIVRYAADFVILCKSRSEAQQVLSILEEWASSVKLVLHPEKTCIVNACERGADHQRWKNSYFAAHGLFSLVAARQAACQSVVR